LTARVKLGLALAIAAGLAAAGFALGRRSLAPALRENQLALELYEQKTLRAGAELKARAYRLSAEALAGQAKTAPLQKAALRERATGRKLTAPPADCERCFRQVRRELELRDQERGWWIYRDPDVLDDEPGVMELTPQLFADLSPPPCHELIGDRPGRIEADRERPGKRGLSLLPPESSLRAGAGLASYELEFRYHPVRLEHERASLLLGAGGRLSLDRLDSTLYGELSLAAELRW